MSLITIAAGDVIEYHGRQVPASARLFANKKFTTNDGIVVAQGSPSRPKDFYQEFGASLVGVNIRIGTGDAYSTTNSDAKDASYTLCVYDERGHRIVTVYTRLRISPEMDPTTWQNIKDYSSAVRLGDAPTYMNSDILLRMFDDIKDGAALGSEVQHGVMRLDVPAHDLQDPVAVGVNSPLITALAGPGAAGKAKLDVAPVDPNNPIAVGVNSPLVTTKASAVAEGKTRLSRAPANPAIPIALGSNDPILGDIEQHLNGYPSLPLAIAALDETQTNLIIKSNTMVSTNIAIPDNITVDFKDEGKLTTADHVTVTIGSMKDPGSRKIFDGSGTVKFDKGAVEKMNVCWWAGAADNLDVTLSIDRMLASCVGNGGGRLFFPDGKWLSNGGHILPTGTTIEGGGAYRGPLSVAGMTAIVLKQPDTFLFKVVDSTNDIRLRSIRLDGEGLVTGSTGILLEGTAPNSSANFVCEDSAIHGFTKGFDVHSLGGSAGAWQFALVSFKNCSIAENTNSAVSVNTVNTGLSFEGCMFVVGIGGYVFDIANCGTFSANDCEFAGPNPYQPCSGGVPGAGMAEAVFNITGQHLPININGCQDEGFRYFLKNSASDFYSRINIDGCEVQAIIQLDASCSVISKANVYSSSMLIRDSVSASPSTIVSIGDHIAVRDACGSDTRDRTDVVTNAASSDITAGILASPVPPPTNYIPGFNSNMVGWKVKLTGGAPACNHKATITAVPNSSTLTLSIPPPVTSTGVTLTFLPTLTKFDGLSIVAAQINPIENEMSFRMPASFLSPKVLDIDPENRKIPILAAGLYTESAANKPLLRLGNTTLRGVFDNYYDFIRELTDPDTLGRLKIKGNQEGYKGFDLNSDVYAEGAVRSASIEVADFFTGSLTIDPVSANNFFALLANGNRTIAMKILSAAEKTRADGQIVTLKLIQPPAGGPALGTFPTTAGQFAFCADIPAIVLSTAANAKDVITFQYDKGSDRWFVIDLKKGFA